MSRYITTATILVGTTLIGLISIAQAIASSGGGGGASEQMPEPLSKIALESGANLSNAEMSSAQLAVLLEGFALVNLP
ncbi:hypothetical protein [Caballeronia mineralivorans]|jgi:hypothetical protein|uniref:hypothetical protein n=1 Tax=Caballeronia mineralivorans TaxID=2010198 RepID=UPI0023F32892|nr:hypothetical protein [Caballeronia mineralivorans]MDB5787687.1 hypothetical protein [Caballeronia mineralivorans]